MGYLIASRYNIILVCLSLKQNITIFPLRTAPPTDVSLHRLLCTGHVYDSHFVQVKMIYDCLIPTADILWCTHCYPKARLWSSYYIAWMQSFTQLIIIWWAYIYSHSLALFIDYWTIIINKSIVLINILIIWFIWALTIIIVNFVFLE